MPLHQQWRCVLTLDSLSWLALGAISSAVFLGGLTKGALGIGMPLLAMPVMALFMTVPQALTVLTIPILVTNIWQALQGGHLKAMVQRFWDLALALAIGIAIGAQALVVLDAKLLYLVMGLVVLIQPVLRFCIPDFQFSPRTQRVVGPIFALASGVIGGMTGFFGPLLMVYLASLGLLKDHFAAAVSMMFVIGALSLGISLAQLGFINGPELTVSLAALLPAVAGIYLGQLIRSHISQSQFERGLGFFLLLIGLSLLLKAF
jgi:uncharacterized membrane protein YfcA